MMQLRIRMILAAGLATLAANASTLRAGDEELRQWSTIGALLRGHYDGVVTLGEVLRAGDFGLGTLEALDGELLIHEGRAWQIDARGAVHEPADSTPLPFVAVTRFEADVVFDVPAGLDLAGLQARVDAARDSANYVYAVRVTGAFASVKTRSVPRQQKPYPPLADVVKTQSLFNFADTRGLLVGFVCPSWAGGLNVPGHHYHFLTDARDGGGHVLGLVTGEGVRVELDLTPDFAMRLPVEAGFGALDLSGDRAAELHAVESDRR
ncbi:MAG: acetolactate decarboxylase [Verrucomicrobiota bacterium]